MSRTPGNLEILEIYWNFKPHRNAGNMVLKILNWANGTTTRASSHKI